MFIDSKHMDFLQHRWFINSTNSENMPHEQKLSKDGYGHDNKKFCCFGFVVAVDAPGQHSKTFPHSTFDMYPIK